MATRQSMHVDVQERDDFDRLLEDIERSPVDEVVVDVVADADVLNTPAEFAELALRARAWSIEVRISTDDPIRRELAMIYGLAVSDESNQPTGMLFTTLSDQTTVISRRPADDEEAADVEPLPFFAPPPNGDLLAPRGGARFDPDASYSFVISPPVQQRFVTGETAEYATQRQPRRPTPRRERATRTIDVSALVTAAVVVGAAVVVILIGLLAPSASIALVPETRPISVEMSYGVAGAGVPLDVEIQPQSIMRTLVFEGSTRATGERFEPDEAARGMVFLTNPLSQTILVPAGTSLTSLDGTQTFTTSEDIEIPAADPFGSATFGTAVVDVAANSPGTPGNLAIGALSGELPSGVLYQNRFPLDGGSERAIAVVTEADHERLNRIAEGELAGQVAAALDGELEAGWKLLGEPQAANDLTSRFNVQPGEDAEDVTIRAELVVEGRAYDPSELEAAAREALDARLREVAPDGFRLVDESTTVSTPERIETPGGVAYRVVSNATVEADFGEDFESELADRLEGKSESRAKEMIEDIEGLAGYESEYGPDWLPWEPAPRFSNRISVTIDGS